MRRWILLLIGALALAASPPLEVLRQSAGPASMSEGGRGLDEAFSREFAEERRPEHITVRYSKETWELDWEDWWAYRQGEIDLAGMIGKVRIRGEGAPATPATAATPSPSNTQNENSKEEPKRADLPLLWIAGGAFLGVILISALLIGQRGGKKTRPAPLPPARPRPALRPAPMRPPEMAPTPTHLHFLSGSFAGQSIPLRQGLRLGRERDCHVVLDDISISRRHADLVPGPQGWVVRDLGSGNGTTVNGMRIQGEVLLRGDETLAFGEISARLTTS